MIGNLLHRILWSRCDRHRVSFNSDFCPGCIQERTAEVKADYETEPNIVNSLTIRRLLAKDRR